MTSYPLGVICVLQLFRLTLIGAVRWYLTLTSYVGTSRWYLTLVSYVDILHQRHQSMSPNSPLQS